VINLLASRPVSRRVSQHLSQALSRLISQRFSRQVILLASPAINLAGIQVHSPLNNQQLNLVLNRLDNRVCPRRLSQVTNRVPNLVTAQV
jgi:hypothetical protein